jgi:hypothetical protein
MADKKLTIFQRLGQVIGPDSAKLKNVYNQPQRFNLGKDLLKTTDKKEYELAKLQAQQNKYLSQMWKKVENGLYQQSINYETTRIGSYSDFEAMEFYPIIAAALDIIMEEATTINDKGKVLNVYSESSRVKTILQDLFFNRLDIHTSLPMWTRNTVKYGDNFLFLNISDKHGITGAKQMPNYEMERRESGLFDMITGNYTVNNDVPNSDKVKFYWRGRDVEFNSWQMAHFRLLGDDRRLPYGTSYLEKARRIWKQCVHEDTLVWTESGYKKIKELTINDIIYSYDFINKNLVKTKINDVWETGIKETFLLRSRYNNIKLTDNHPILIFNGETYSYKTLNEINIGKDYLVTPVSKNGNEKITIKLPEDNFYIKLNDFGVEKMNILSRHGIMNKLKSISTTDFKNIHRFIQNSGKIKYSYINRLNEEIGLTLDDVDVFYKNTKISMVNKDLTFVGDSDFFNFFGFMLGDGWLVKNVGIGFALGIYDDSNQKYIDYVKNAFKDKIIITQSKHSEFSKSVIINSSELNQIMKAFGFITGFSKKVLPEWVFSLDLKGKREIIKGLFEADGSDKYGVIGLANKKLIVGLKELCNQSGIASGKITTYPSKVKYNKLTNKTEVRQESYKLYINFNNVVDDVRHEKVISYESIGMESVWDLTTENELHNFIGDGIVVHNCILAEDSMLVYRVTRAPERRVYKIFVGNIDDADVPAYVNEIADRFKRTPIVDSQTGQMDLRFNQLSNDQDFFIPVRSESSPSPIETLPGAQNLDQIADIEYLRNNLFTALRIPKPFLGFDEASGEGKNLALQDIRFSRTVNRVQQSMLQELNKIAIIHLYLLGFEDELDNFSLTLNNPSTQAEMLKIEHLQQKITLLKDAVGDTGNGFGTMSWTRAHREILGWSNDEIKKDLLEQRMEKAASSELANTPNVIKHTGMFDDVDKIYGDYEAALKGGGEAQAADDSGSAPSLGGGGGGGGFSGSLGGDLGGETEAPELGGETPEAGAEPETPEGGAEIPPAEEPSPEATLTESINLLTERKKILGDNLNKRTLNYKTKFNNLIDSVDRLDETKQMEPIKIYDKNVQINNDITRMITDIDKMLDE